MTSPACGFSITGRGPSLWCMICKVIIEIQNETCFYIKKHHGGTHTFQGVKWAEPCRGKKNRSRPRRVGAHLNTPKNDVFSPEIYSFRVTLFCTLICVCIHHSLESTKGERQPWPTRIQCLVSWVSWVSEPERHTHTHAHTHSNAFSYMMGHTCNFWIRTNKRHGWKSTTSVLATATRHALVQSGLQCFSRHVNSCRTPYFFSIRAFLFCH